jgi:hypothetical protein
LAQCSNTPVAVPSTTRGDMAEEWAMGQRERGREPKPERREVVDMGTQGGSTAP